MNLDVVFGTFPQLETERLALRELRSGDAESLFAVLGDEEVTEFYDDNAFRDVSQASEQIEAWATGFRARRCVRWGIAQRENGEIIGTCGYYGFHGWHKRAGIGYELARSFWRQGIMTEALGAIIEFGFKRVGLNRIEAVVMLENEASVKLLEGLGFRQEGVLREYENWGDKGCVDLMMFSLLRREYEGEGIIKATTIPELPDAKSPAGADIRFLMDGETGNMIHCTVPPHQINKATVHATVSEFWYVLEGHGEIWRDNGLESCVTTLVPGTSIDIPVGTAFQYRNVSDVDLKFICIAMPPWPGDSEATYVKGKWQPTI